jgi:hypothetical protein
MIQQSWFLNDQLSLGGYSSYHRITIFRPTDPKNGVTRRNNGQTQIGGSKLEADIPFPRHQFCILFGSKEDGHSPQKAYSKSLSGGYMIASTVPGARARRHSNVLIIIY